MLNIYILVDTRNRWLDPVRRISSIHLTCRPIFGIKLRKMFYQKQTNLVYAKVARR